MLNEMSTLLSAKAFGSKPTATPKLACRLGAACQVSNLGTSYVI